MPNSAEFHLGERENRSLFKHLETMTVKRVQPGEPIVAADYDAELDYYDFNNKVFDYRADLTSPQLLGIFSALVDRGTGNGRQWVRDMVGSMREQLAETDVAERLENGERLTVLTAHKTRFEPVAVGLLLEAALADGDEKKFNQLRAKSMFFISVYLRCANLALADLTGNQAMPPRNMISVIQQLGAVATTFPDTTNMRKRSAINQKLFERYNSAMLREYLARSKNTSLITLAANATMEGLDENRVYNITRVAPGTASLVRPKRTAVLAVASAHDAPKPFSTISRLVEPGEVTADTAHQAMNWIAATLRASGIPATYNAPPELPEPNQFFDTVQSRK